GENDVRTRVLHKHHLSDKEVAEVNRLVDEGIGLLFMRKDNVQAVRRPACLSCTTVCGFHCPRAATGDHAKSRFSESASNLASEFIVGVIWFEPGRSEHGNGRAEFVQGSKAVFELMRDSFQPRALALQRS